GISHEISLSSGCTLIILHAEHAEINRLFHLACLLKQIEQRTDCKLPALARGQEPAVFDLHTPKGIKKYAFMP
ncbi:MAG: hypothetical protein SO122_04855, partial [Eubacteriales bacterium]|nr:hypothetical protein [Eubacteriales bacterium]